VERSAVRVEDARGQPPNIPFWVGEAPGRSDELSHAVSRLRGELAERIDNGRPSPRDWLIECGVDGAGADQVVDYLAAAKAALGVLPTQDTIVLERFFDEAGDMHLVIHSPYGSRINRAWGARSCVAGQPGAVPRRCMRGGAAR
jgi:ATP-dependent Lhr-like helicase